MIPALCMSEALRLVWIAIVWKLCFRYGPHLSHKCCDLLHVS